MNLPRTVINRVKARAAKNYEPTCVSMVNSLVRGTLLHCDETPITVRGQREFAWVFCNWETVVFRRTESREGAFIKQMLEHFKGVLVSDFYAAYDSLDCQQQKCLIHLIRDLNNDLYKEPFNEEIKTLAYSFGTLLKEIVRTIDRFGLKTWFLRKHRKSVTAFFTCLANAENKSDIAAKYRKRFESNRNVLFTFLEHDDVPWNNNTAEHAIKGLGMLRRVLGSGSTRDGMDDYLTLLSVCETCKCMGIRFLDFLLSGEKDIHAFAESKGRRKRKTPQALENAKTG